MWIACLLRLSAKPKFRRTGIAPFVFLAKASEVRTQGESTVVDCLYGGF